MNNSQKVLMSLVSASISALASAPALADNASRGEAVNPTDNGDKAGTEAPAKMGLIDLSKVVAVSLPTSAQGTASPALADHITLKEDLRSQVATLLKKKDPTIKLYENISVVVENYGYGAQDANNSANEDANKQTASIKEEVFKDLQLAQNRDSTSIGGSGGTTIYIPSNTTSACHAICHTACHTACHGARGWR